MSKRKIYLASSWRNADQPRLVTALRGLGHEIYDFRHPSHGGPEGGSEGAFDWSEIDPSWREWTPSVYRNSLNHPLANHEFKSDFAAMRWSDTCVLLLPSGPSAAIEAGWCAGSGRDLIVHVCGLREPDLMYKLARKITLSDEELFEALDDRINT